MAHALNINAYAGYAGHAAQPGIFARLHQVVADHLASVDAAGTHRLPS